MGACASKFTVLKNASTAPPPAVKCEVESGEVHLVEEVAVEKDDAPAVDDEAKRRQSLGHLLQEGEEKKSSADSHGKASEDASEVKLEAVADAAAQDEREKAAVADGLKLKCTEEDIPAKQNVEIEADKVEDEPAETLKPETAAVEIACADDKEPEILETEKTEEKKSASDEEIKKEEKLAEAERSEEQCPAPDAEKKETDEKLAEIMEIPKEPATEEQEPASEAEKKNSEEKPCEISNEKPETEKAADTDKSMMEEKPAENSQVEDKHVLEPQTTENLLPGKAPETCSEEQKPEKTKAEEEKAK